jgi:hypothetical protein
VNDVVLRNAKAWTALVGAVVTALLGTVAPDNDAYQWLTALAAVCTAIATYAVPNQLPPE